MRIAVGSGNPVKRDATARVFGEAAVDARVVGSGVSEQPVGHPETRRGAAVRAQRALASVDERCYDLGVGIEGGVAAAGGPDTGVGEALEVVGGGLSLVMWAAVTDGSRLSWGGGPTLPLPDHVATRLRRGEALGPVMDDVLGTDGVAKRQGAAGALTDGRLSRTDALETAVAAAAGPFLSGHY